MNPLNIVLVRPPQPYLYVDSHYPIGLGVLGARLQSAGHRVSGLALSVGEQHVPPADWFLVTSTTPSYRNARQWAARARRLLPNARLAIGGPHASALPQEVSNDGVWDHVVIGEADEAVTALVQDAFAGIPIVGCSPPDCIDTVPARDLFPRRWMTVDGLPAANVMLTRGCPFHCKFCASGGILFRRRGEDSIREEFRQLRDDGAQAVVLNDDTPVMTDDDLDRICRLMREFDFRFRLNMRADQVDARRAAALRRAGCAQVNIGVEIATDRVLREIRKGITAEQSIEAFHVLRQHGLRAKALLIHGLPGTGVEEAEAMVAFVRRARPDCVTLSSFFPVPGSPYFEEMRETIARTGADISDFLYHGEDGDSRRGVRHLPSGVLSSEELGRLKRVVWDRIEAMGVAIDRGELSAVAGVECGVRG